MITVTQWLITRRDNAADAWLHALQADKPERASKKRLDAWDTLLAIWTNNGTRWT